MIRPSRTMLARALVPDHVKQPSQDPQDVDLVLQLSGSALPSMALCSVNWQACQGYVMRRYATFDSGYIGEVALGFLITVGFSPLSHISYLFWNTRVIYESTMVGTCNGWCKSNRTGIQLGRAKQPEFSPKVGLHLIGAVQIDSLS